MLTPGGSATTTDVLAVYGRQLQVTCPLLLGYSRGADGIVVRSDIRRLNQLTGKTTVAAQFNESDFFLRYLAQEAGIGINMLSSLDETPAPDKINLVYAEDAFVACDLFAKDVESGANRLAACVTWAPKTTETVNASNNKARLLTTNKNLLVVSDILLVNQADIRVTPLEIGGGFKRDLVRSKYAAVSTKQGWRVDRTAMTAADSGDSGWIVQNQPAGFTKLMELRRSMPGKSGTMSHLVYSDGLAAISVFIEPGVKADKKPALRHQGAVSIYTRPVNGYSITVLGETPAETVMQLARALEPKPGVTSTATAAPR